MAVRHAGAVVREWREVREGFPELVREACLQALLNR